MQYNIKKILSIAVLLLNTKLFASEISNFILFN